MSYEQIDPRVLFCAIGEDLDAFRALSQTFLDISPPLFERLQRALAAADCNATALESHSLRGATALVGAVQLTALLQDVESHARRGTVQPGLPQMAELARQFGVVMHEVRLSMVEFQGRAG